MPSERSPDLTSAIRLLPCLGCPFGGRAIEEVVGTYLSYLNGERRLRFDTRQFPHLPKACCRQARPDVDALIA
jgi:hypothetical protein